MAANSDDNRRYGDEQDSPSGVGQNMKDLGNKLKSAKDGANTAKNVGEATKVGAEMAQNAANAAVNTATTTAVSTGAGVAAGAATGSIAGPVGTAVGAAWGMRHTIVKVLGAIGIFFLAIVCLFHSLPDVIYYSIFGFDGGNNESNLTIEQHYELFREDIQKVIDEAYAEAVEDAQAMIKKGDYDYDISLMNLTDNAKESAQYDVANILATYSVMLGEDESPSRSELINKLSKYKDEFFPITSEVKKEVTVVPTEYWTYSSMKIPIVTNKSLIGYVNGVPQYGRYQWEIQTVYYRDEKLVAEEPIEIDRFKQVTGETGQLVGMTLTNVHSYTYYVKDGKTTVSPTEVEVEYLAVTINSFDSSVLTEAFDYDPNAIYRDTNKTNAEIVELQTDGLKSLIYGNYTSGTTVPLTDAELIAVVNSLDCNDTRKALVQTGLSLVGRIPYFWGGKSSAGWNEKWGTPQLVTAPGNSTTGTIQPYGMDCTGFTDWVYKTTLGITLYEGSWKQVQNCHPISESELKAGDLGFLFNSDGVTTNHVLMFVKYDENGNRMWVHCTAGYNGVVYNHPHYDVQLKLYRPNNVDYGDE